MLQLCQTKYFIINMKKQNYPKKNIPRIIQRSNDIVVACRNDKDELAEHGLSWEVVKELAEMVPLCSDTDVQYRLQKETISLATKHFKEYESACFRLRSDLWQAINDAFVLCGIKIQLQGVSQKKSRSALVQDLNDLAYISRLYREQFVKAHFNYALSEKAAHTARELDEKIVWLHIEREVLRCVDQPQRYAQIGELCKKMDTICKYGRRAFARNPIRRHAYREVK
jgi:hypothetical protein